MVCDPRPLQPPSARLSAAGDDHASGAATHGDTVSDTGYSAPGSIGLLWNTPQW